MNEGAPLYQKLMYKYEGADGVYPDVTIHNSPATPVRARW